MSDSHPGSLLREYLKYHNWSFKDLADRTGVSTHAISEICSERMSITSDIATYLEREFGHPAYLWLNMQSWYDLAVERAR